MQEIEQTTKLGDDFTEGDASSFDNVSNASIASYSKAQPSLFEQKNNTQNCQSSDFPEAEISQYDKQAIDINFIKTLGRERTVENLNRLIEMYDGDFPFAIKREIVSSIGRQYEYDKILSFIEKNVFTEIPMDFVYQMYRTTLYKSHIQGFEILKEKIEEYYHNEIIDRMKFFHDNKGAKPKRCTDKITKPTLLVGDSANTLKTLAKGSVDLIFTSPPYYNAREYSSYHSYQDYLDVMKGVLQSCHHVLSDGRFIVINVSPVITKRPGREFESIRYPIHFDYHKILSDVGFYFVDEIIWAKPEYSVPNRVGGYLQTRMPLSYKPNCITESVMVYRKDAPFLLDKNIAQYGKDAQKNDNDIDATNCWYINPKSSKNHPAVFPELLCKKILKYYSFEGDVVLDPFAGSGTLGRAAKMMKRVPLLCEKNKDYAQLIAQEGYYVSR